MKDYRIAGVEVPEGPEDLRDCLWVLAIASVSYDDEGCH